MKVYIVTKSSGEGDFYTKIEDVFANKEKAEKLADKLRANIKLQQKDRHYSERDFVEIEERLVL